MELPDYVLKLLKQLNEHGYEAYVVGGAVRSYLLHLPIHDYDLTTNAMPLEIKEVFHDFHTIDTGIQHGTVTVIIDHHPIEITTYRKDSGY
ncbi:MAG: tRNA nucleotidyltransferase, partial [Solobacterium sp.]|nr:tRNA nucleotidyltransferase [Solobacterium sp.]